MRPKAFQNTVILLICLLSGCVTPLDQEPGAFEASLVVEGFINDDFGPHDFRITRVTRFAGVLQGGAIVPIDAEVTITDQLGNVTQVERKNVLRKENVNVSLVGGCLPETRFIRTKTLHQTPSSFRGVIGNTYTLEVRVDGKTYRSTPETMLPTPAIESLNIEFKELPSLNDVNAPSGVEINARWNDPAAEKNYYTWVINGTYAISTPDKSTESTCCLYDTNDGGAMQCWIVERNLEDHELAFDDVTIDGQLASHTVGFIQDDGLRFASQAVPSDKQYHVEVVQYQISEDAFAFFSAIKRLSEIDGDIFDPLPETIRGNIRNVEDPDELVIGHFGAFSAQKKGIFIPRSLFPFVQRFTQPCGDCRTRSGAQIDTPEPYL
ncbi:MAG: DUF4249 domain-containing protein [Bacteroidota bacterium]